MVDEYYEKLAEYADKEFLELFEIIPKIHNDYISLTKNYMVSGMLFDQDIAVDPTEQFTRIFKRKNLVLR